MKLIDTIEVNNELGEGVVWDTARQKVWWTDIAQSELYRYEPSSKKLESWNTPERLACFAPVANQPYLIAAFESGFAYYDPISEQLDWLHKLETDKPGIRFNDGRTDRQGRLWAATMVENQDTAVSKGSLYCLNNDLSINKTIGGLSIPNSLCWSPDGQTMYHTDTPTHQINQYHFDTNTGTLSAPKCFSKTEPNCYPDGSIVDADGYLWNAQWGASQIVRYAPTGIQDLVLEVPTSQPTCVAFGGTELNLLFVTSAYQDMNAEQRSSEPNAGNLFVYETHYKGLVESPFIATE